MLFFKTILFGNVLKSNWVVIYGMVHSFWFLAPLKNMQNASCCSCLRVAPIFIIFLLFCFSLYCLNFRFVWYCDTFCFFSLSLVTFLYCFFMIFLPFVTFCCSLLYWRWKHASTQAQATTLWWNWKFCEII